LNGDASLFALIDREGKYRAGEAGKDAILESLLKVEALARKGNVL
jgi:hypothetical protein